MLLLVASFILFIRTRYDNGRFNIGDAPANVNTAAIDVNIVKINVNSAVFIINNANVDDNIAEIRLSIANIKLNNERDDFTSADAFSYNHQNN